MQLIGGFTTQAKQETRLVLDDRSRAILMLEYVSNQKGWFYSLTYGEFVTKGRRLATSLNALRQYSKLIPFGISVITTEGDEPTRITDLADGRTQIYLLNAQDVKDVEDQFYAR